MAELTQKQLNEFLKSPCWKHHKEKMKRKRKINNAGFTDIENLKNKISDLILDFADNTADLPRGDKQGIAETLAGDIIKLFNN